MDNLAYMGVPVNAERALFIQMMQAIAHKAEQETDEFWGDVYDQLQDPRKAKMMGDKWRLALEAMRFGQRLPALNSNQEVDLKQANFIEFAANQRITAYFDESGQLIIPSGQGRSVPLALGISWQAWQTAIYLAMGILPNLQDQGASQQYKENADGYHDGRTGQHVDWSLAPADASHYRIKDAAFYKETPGGIVCYNSALRQWDTRICNVSLDTGRWITRPAYVLVSQQTKLRIEGFALPVEKQVVISVLARYFKGQSHAEIRTQLNIALAKSRNIVTAFNADKIPPAWIEEARATELPDAD